MLRLGSDLLKNYTDDKPIKQLLAAAELISKIYSSGNQLNTHETTLTRFSLLVSRLRGNDGVDEDKIPPVR